MKKIITAAIASLFLCGLLSAPVNVAAQTDAPENKLLNRLTNVAKEGGFQTDANVASTPIIIGTIIGAFLGFLGITFIVIMIIAGFGYMRARGNEEEIKKAVASIREAIIGLVISMSAYAVWNFIFRNLIIK
ncbi:MAG: hypothetical protein WC456_03395 [Patescibacteria group bacterium]